MAPPRTVEVLELVRRAEGAVCLAKTWLEDVHTEEDEAYNASLMRARICDALSALSDAYEVASLMDEEYE